MAAMLIGFSEFLLPSFLDFFHQNDFAMGYSTEIFIEFAKVIKLIAEFVFNPVVIVSFAALVLMYMVLRPLRILLSRFAVSVPLFGDTYLKLLQHLYLKTFSKLLMQGHHLDQAILYSADIIPNSYLKERVVKISAEILKNGQIADAIGISLRLEHAYLALIKTGERTASLATYSEICADTIQKHFQISLKRILTWTGPILVTTMGIVTVFMVIAVVLPIYEQASRLG
jgi:type II secretory pathway component PulF